MSGTLGEKMLVRLALSLILVSSLVSCKSDDSSPIVIPPGQELSFSTEEFLKYSDNNFEMKVRSVVDNTTLMDVADLTAISTNAAQNKSTNFSYIVPKTISLNGLAVVDIVSKSTGINWKAIILDPAQVVQPTVETTLLYEILSKYDAKSIKSYRTEDLKDLLLYIQEFSVQRQDLFGITGAVKATELYRFLRNGLGSDVTFLNKVKNMGMNFNFDAQGRVLSIPYPFGLKNNAPLIDSARSTPSGSVGAFETIRVDIRLEGRDPDGDRLFYYFHFLEDNSILKDEKIWKWTPGYDQARVAPYQLRAFLSDGSMDPIAMSWDITVADNNRPPKITGTCPAEVVEGQKWVCDLGAGDPDPDDKTRFSLAGANFPYSVPIINGTPWVPGASYESESLHIEWTPSNRDFLKSKLLTTIQLVVSDYTSTGTKKNGDDVKMINIAMKGANSPPFPVAGPAGQLNWNTPIDDPPRVLDTSFLPNGVPFDADTRTANKKFFFEIVLADSDNTSLASDQQDIATLRVNNGAESIRPEPDDNNFTRETRLVNGVNIPVTVFKYSWQPTTSTPQVIATFTPFDDMQNGQGTDFTVLLTSQPRSSPPTCGTSPTSNFSVSSALISALFYTQCPDRPQPAISTWNMSTAADAAGLIAFMRTTIGAEYGVFTRKVSSNAYTMTEQDYGPVLSYTIYNSAQAAGAVRFRRSATCDAAHIPTTTINIPAATQVQTAYVETPYVPRIIFRTAVAAVLGPLDCEVVIPVTAVSRSAAINALKVIFPMSAPMTAQGLAVRNDVAVNYEKAASTVLTFTRTNSTTPLTIPAGTQIRTDEPAGAQSITYVIPSDFTMDVNESSKSITAIRDYNSPANDVPSKTQTYYDHTARQFLSRVPAGTAIAWRGAAIAGLAIDTPAALYPRSGFTIETYKNSPATTAFNMKFTFADGSMPLANEISVIAPSGLEAGTESAPVLAARSQAEFTQVQVRNSAWTDPLNGTVELYRAAGGASLSIPAGLVVGTPDRRLYQLIESATLSGTSTGPIAATRIYESSYRPSEINRKVSMSDSNNGISFLAFPTARNIPSGSESSFKIEVTDNSSQPLIPKDSFDRMYVKEYKVSTGTAMTPSKIKMCREPSGGCTPCNQTPASPPPATDPYVTLNLGSLSHEQSRFCYFRVTPDQVDVATTFRYNIKMCDYGQTSTATESCAAQDLQFYVLEANTRPYFTNVHSATVPGTPLGSTTAAELGTASSASFSIPTPFNESQAGSYTVYAYDPDKDAGNKTLSFEVLPQVYHLKPTDLGLRAKPTGLQINASSIVNTPLSSGTGNMARANLIWTPTDDDAKVFSSAEGFIVGVRVLDNKTNSAVSQSQILYLNVKMSNVNNTPTISAIGNATNANTYTVNADTYFKQSFTAADLDRATPVGGTFQTVLSACWNADGSRAANSYFDSGNTDPAVCHLSGPEWTAGSFDPNYTGNASVAACRSGASLNADLAAPKVTRLGGSSNVGNTIQYSFQIEWCPQKGHVGSYSFGLQVFDNGDVDVQGTTAARKGGYAPLYLKVIAPVYLISPQMDLSGTTTLKSIRQTAANITASPFTYQILAKNSKGNPIAYSILSAPRACGVPNGVCVDPVSGVVTWIPSPADVTDGQASTNKKIVVQATDTVTGESARGTIDLWVQDPTTYPGEQGPSILVVTPNTATQPQAKEMVATTFTVVATDSNINSSSNHDKLFARFYVDGVIVNDAEMDRQGATANWQASFDYKPQPGDGSRDMDGFGPMPIGQHRIMIEVTDGNFTDTRQWLVNVRNTIPLPELALDIPAERKALESSITFSNWIWGAEVAATTSFSSTSQRFESVYASGSFVRAGVTKYYIWALDLVNGVVTKTGADGKWSFNDNLNWGALTKRVSYKTDPVTSVNDIFVTNVASKYGPFNAVTNSLKMNGDLTRYSNPLPTALTCSGCAPSHYQNAGSGNVLNVTYNGNRNIYANGTVLYWDATAAGPAQAVAGWPAGYTVTGIALNAATKRLYVSATKSTLTENKIVVYNLAPLLNTTPTTPTKVTEINVSAQAGWTIQAPSMPGDIVINTAQSPARIFVYLRGTGGLATFTDDGATISALATIGLGSIPSSASDPAMTGSKLSYDPRSELVWGISREARVVFSVDPITFEVVQKPTPAAFDALWALPTGTSFLIDRTNSRIYVGK